MTARSRPSHGTAVAVAGALAVSLAGTACSEPPPPDGPVGATGDEVGEVPPAEDDDASDDARDALTDALVDLHDTIAAAEADMRSAADADGLSAARADAQRALGGLLDGTGARSSPAVLPAETPERDTIGDRDDLLSATLTLARDVGGAAGTSVVALLRDELAGDLGAWERDAEGVVASVSRAASTGGGLDALTAAILELPGETTRALAWTMVAVEASDLDTATTAASRAAAHLELATVATDDVVSAFSGDAGSTADAGSSDDSEGT